MQPMTSEARSPESDGLRMLAGRSFVYALGGLAYKGVALVSVPLLARLLKPAELGLLDAAAVLASIIGLVAGLGSEQAVAWLEPRYKNDGKVWGSTLALVAGAGTVVFLAVLVGREPLAASLTGDPRNADVVVAAGFYGIVIAFTAAALNSVRLHGTPARYALSSFLVVSAEMVAALVIAWRLDSPVRLMVLGWAAAAAVVSAGILILHAPRPARPHLSVIRDLMRFGAPLVPAALAWIAGDLFIRSSVARDASLATLGEYGVAYRVTSALAIVVAGFAVAWQPYVYGSAVSDAFPRARRTAPALVALLGWAATILTLMGHEIVAIISGPNYADAVHGIAALAGGIAALGVFMLLGALASATYGTRRVGVVALVGMVVQAALAIMLVTPLGLVGAALASLAGYVVSAALLVWLTGFMRSDAAGAAFLVSIVFASLGLVAASSLASSDFSLRLTAAILFTVVAALVMLLLQRRALWVQM